MKETYYYHYRLDLLEKWLNEKANQGLRLIEAELMQFTFEKVEEPNFQYYVRIFRTGEEKRHIKHGEGKLLIHKMSHSSGKISMNIKGQVLIGSTHWDDYQTCIYEVNKMNESNIDRSFNNEAAYYSIVEKAFSSFKNTMLGLVIFLFIISLVLRVTRGMVPFDTTTVLVFLPLFTLVPVQRTLNVIRKRKK